MLQEDNIKGNACFNQYVLVCCCRLPDQLTSLLLHITAQVPHWDGRCAERPTVQMFKRVLMAVIMCLMCAWLYLYPATRAHACESHCVHRQCKAETLAIHTIPGLQDAGETMDMLRKTCRPRIIELGGVAAVHTNMLHASKH